ncbi:sugar phosphate nucleotidyltransferase [Calditerricola yamamurae]
MKGVILAGGAGTRLRPATCVLNKHLLPIGPYPLILFVIGQLKRAGITDLLLVTGKDDLGDFAAFLGSGEAYGVSLTYRVQERPAGIADALRLAQPFTKREKFVAVLGDNLFEDDLTPWIQAFAQEGPGARVLLKAVPDPRPYGVAEVRDGRIVSLEEKPACPKSAFCVTGIYLFDEQVYAIIADLAPSPRGEFEITDVNRQYLARGQLRYGILSGWWIDAGTPEALWEANRRFAERALSLHL